MLGDVTDLSGLHPLFFEKFPFILLIKDTFYSHLALANCYCWTLSVCVCSLQGPAHCCALQFPFCLVGLAPQRITPFCLSPSLTENESLISQLSSS